MDNQKMNTERLIASFEKDTFGNWVTVYRTEDDDNDWNYFLSLTGMLNNLYFHVRISNFKLKNVDEIEIASTTDCKEEIEALLMKFNLV